MRAGAESFNPQTPNPQARDTTVEFSPSGVGLPHSFSKRAAL